MMLVTKWRYDRLVDRVEELEKQMYHAGSGLNYDFADEPNYPYPPYRVHSVPLKDVVSRLLTRLSLELTYEPARPQGFTMKGKPPVPKAKKK